MKTDQGGKPKNKLTSCEGGLTATPQANRAKNANPQEESLQESTLRPRRGWGAEDSEGKKHNQARALNRKEGALAACT